MSKIQWDSQLYLRYERERTQPSIDLLSKIGLESPGGIIDLGCGPGNSTRVLRERWPAARITGLDSSTAMIEKARQSQATVEWRVGDIQTWYEPNRFDLIFANASLHWVSDHESLTKRLFEAVKPSGVFAFQMPALYLQPAEQAIRDVSESPAITPARRPTRAPDSHTGRILRLARSAIEAA
jgi:trans-aconitate 2-methyltransferase